MTEIQEPMSDERVISGALLTGQILTLTGFLFSGLGIYLILQTNAWQAYSLVLSALIVTIGSTIGTIFISKGRGSLGGWILLSSNLFGPAIASLAITRIGLISVPYMLISSILIIRLLFPGRGRKSATVFAILTILTTITIEIINPGWTLDSQLVLNIGPVFVLGSFLFGLLVLYLGPVWYKLHIREKLIGSISILSIILIVVLTSNSINNS